MTKAKKHTYKLTYFTSYGDEQHVYFKAINESCARREFYRYYGGYTIKKVEVIKDYEKII